MSLMLLFGRRRPAWLSGGIDRWASAGGPALDAFAALLSLKIAKANQGSPALATAGLTVTGDAMDRTGRPARELKARCRIWQGIVWKLDLDMLPSPSQFKKKAGRDNIRDLHDFLHGRRFRGKPSEASRKT